MMYKNKLLHTLPEKSEIYSYNYIHISTFPSTFHMFCAYTELFINMIEAIVNLYFFVHNRCFTFSVLFFNASQLFIFCQRKSDKK